MWKYSLVLGLLFSGCTYFEFNFAMCENVGPNSDPSMIEQCRNYNDEEATKAFNKTKVKAKNQEDVVEYKKEEK